MRGIRKESTGDGSVRTILEIMSLISSDERDDCWDSDHFHDMSLSAAVG